MWLERKTWAVLAAAAALASPLSALAASDGQPVATASSGSDDALSRWMQDAPPVAPTLGAAHMGDGVEPLADRGIHGEVGAAIGSNGYRSIYGVATGPLGKNGSLTIAASESRGRVWNRRSVGLALDLHPASAAQRQARLACASPDGSSDPDDARCAQPADDSAYPGRP